MLYDYLNNYFTLTYFNKGVFQCLKKPLSTQQMPTTVRQEKAPIFLLSSTPMEVAAIVAAMTLDQDMLCAAVLHDVVEDCDGISIDDIRREFGDIVASYVYQESEDKSKTWVERKGHTIDFLKNRASRNAKIIALGDKLANIRALYRDYNILGEELWERFNMKDKKMQSWYYRGMIEGFADLSEFHEYEEYCQLVNEVFPEE